MKTFLLALFNYAAVASADMFEVGMRGNIRDLKGSKSTSKSKGLPDNRRVRVQFKKGAKENDACRLQ